MKGRQLACLPDLNCSSLGSFEHLILGNQHEQRMGEHGGLFGDLQRIVCRGGPGRWLVAETQVIANADADLRMPVGCTSLWIRRGPLDDVDQYWKTCDFKSHLLYGIPRHCLQIPVSHAH